MRMVKEAGCEAVKLEGGGEASCSRARAIVGAGIPVMGHVGLTPQTSTALGGWKAQGRTAAAAARIAAEALALQEAGCFALVFEAIPSAVTEELMPLHRDPRDRHRRRARDRRAGARLPRPARHPRRARSALRQALREPPAGDERRRQPPTPRTCARAATRRPSTPTRSTPPSSRAAARAAAHALSRSGGVRGAATPAAAVRWPYSTRRSTLAGAPAAIEKRLDVVRDDAVRADHAALADRHAARDDHVGAQPAVIADPRRALALKALPVTGLSGSS